MPRTVSLLFAALLAATLSSQPGWADQPVPPPSGGPEFQVTIRFFSADQPEPLSEHQILFRDGLTYDLIRKPADQTRFVTLYDPAAERIVLLDRQTKSRLQLATESLVELTAKTKAAAGDPATRAALGLEARPEVSEDGQRYAIGFGKVAYETTTRKPDDPRLALRFGEFTDWAARLNIARQVDAPPPFARMSLNRALVAAGRLPDTMTVTFRGSIQPAQFRVEHQWSPHLSEADRRKIAEVESMMALYREVPFDEFPR